MLIILVSLLVLDAIWIGINMNRYSTMVSTIQRSVLTINAFAAFIAYLFIYGLIVFSIVPQLNKFEKTTIWDCIKISGIVGICVYGIYNFTNLALYKDYYVSIAIADTIWGGVLFTLVAIIYQIYKGKMIM